MKCLVLLVCVIELAVSLPQGYNYKEPVVIESNLGGFKPILNDGAPCNHGPNAAALVQHQSTGRIINHQQGPRDVHIANGGLDSQAVTVNSHIVVGDGGHSQVFREGQGYAEQGRIQPAPIPLPQGPVLPSPGPAQAFVQTAQQAFGSSSSYNSQSGGAIINGIGKVPPPPQALSGGYQYAGGFGGNKFSSGAGFGGPIRGPSFLGAPVNQNFISGPSRPIGISAQKFGGGVFQGSSANLQNLGGGSSHFQSGGGHGGFSQQLSGGFSQGGSSHSLGVGSLSQSSNFGGNAILNGALGNVIRETFANAPLDPTVEKHIYVHVPPEDLEEREVRQQIRLPEIPAKKHYKIIFIKAPTVNQQSTYTQIANAGLSEEKTIVYVLVKKPEEPSIGEIQQIQQNIKPSKPEVYFIKYKTRKEEGPIGGGFIGGGGYNSNIDQSGGGQQINAIGSGQFEGSDIDSNIDVRLNGSGSSIESSQSGGSYSSSSSSSSIGGSYVSGGGSVNIGETGAQHAVYGVPNVK